VTPHCYAWLFKFFEKGQQPLFLRSQKCQTQMIRKHVDCHNTFSYVWPLFLKRLWGQFVPQQKPQYPIPQAMETTIQCTQACFSPTHSYTRTYDGPSVDLPFCGSVKNFKGASFFINICLPKYIKKNNPNKGLPLFEVGKLLIMNFMLPEGIQTCLMANMDTSSIENNGIIRRYLRIVWYSIGGICCPNPSIRIARRKYWACGSCRHSKTIFCLVVMSNFTSISQTLLLKRMLVKICCAL